MCVCVCVCARARARACVCVCVCVCVFFVCKYCKELKLKLKYRSCTNVFVEFITEIEWNYYKWVWRRHFTRVQFETFKIQRVNFQARK